jgi:carbon storage regulator CsrA
MLVLSRKAGERIHIGDDVFIEVRRVAGNRVTLAVSAPRTVRVLRGELLEAAKCFEQTPAETHAASTQQETIIITHEHCVTGNQYPVSHTL